MKTVITYGTFDLLHFGHINILKRAKAIGDRLIVGVTSESYDKERGKLNVSESLAQRIENVKQTGLADEIIVEEFEGQKILDIQKYHVDCFVIGSDWYGKFDYLKEYCQVVYLERTRGVSSTELRQQGRDIIKLGVMGSGRIANRFVPESKYISGIDVVGVFNPNKQSAQKFAEKHELVFFSDCLEDFLEKVDAVYIATPHQTHYEYILKALDYGKHVLCEKPITLHRNQLEEIYSKAEERKLVVMEGLKTAYCPAFERLLALAKSGKIGEIKDIDATFTKLVPPGLRELNPAMAGGSMNELGSYVLLPIIKLFGSDYQSFHFFPYMNEDGIDLFVKGMFLYENATASFKVGLGVKSEGELIISGTKGYIWVPAPWWKTAYFEVRYEDPAQNKKYFYQFEGDGLRYEISEFAKRISGLNCSHYNMLCKADSLAFVDIMERMNLEMGKDERGMLK